MSSRLAGAEAIQSGWQQPTSNGINGTANGGSGTNNETTEQLEHLQKFGERLAPITRLMEEANDQATSFAGNSVIVSHALLAKLEDLNSRYIIQIIA